MWTKKLRVAAILAATLTGILGGVPNARAASIEISGITTTQTNGVRNDAYAITLRDNDNLTDNDTNGIWINEQSAPVSRRGMLVTPDLTTAPNVRFQHAGEDFSSGASPAAVGAAYLFSTNAPGLLGNFAARDAGLRGQMEANSDSLTMPGTGAMHSVSLPVTLWMGLVSFAGLGILNRVRRRFL